MMCSQTGARIGGGVLPGLTECAHGEPLTELCRRCGSGGGRVVERHLLAVAVDTVRAEQDGAFADLRRKLERAAATLHGAAGERVRYRGSRQEWPSTDNEAAEQVAGMLRAEAIKPWDLERIRAALEDFQITVPAQLEANRADADATEQHYRDQGGWPRYFAVTSSAGGHTHAHMYCSHRGRTTYGWHPELSGLDEAAAVAALGPQLCTKCFPSAPVEWTVGQRAAARCPGTGRGPGAGSWSRRGMRASGDCPECGHRASLSPNGYVRAHPPA